MTLDEYQNYLLSEIASVRKKDPSPSAFSEAAQILDTLAQAATSPKKHGGVPKSNGDRFRDFVHKYMRPSYSSFRYANGKQDLPTQMYAVLRCGLVHSRSLTPNPPPNGKLSLGRTNSIIIDRGGIHLFAWQDATYDAALFVFGPFIADIEAAIRRVFLNASKQRGLRALLERYIRDHPPVRGLPILRAGAGAFTTATNAPSASFQAPSGSV